MKQDKHEQQQQQQMYSMLVDSQNKMAGVIEYATKLSQLIAQQNKAMNTRNLSTLKQRQNILKTTNMLAETINIQQSKPLSIIADPKCPIFRQNAETIQEWTKT